MEEQGRRGGGRGGRGEWREKAGKRCRGGRRKRGPGKGGGSRERVAGDGIEEGGGKGGT